MPVFIRNFLGEQFEQFILLLQEDTGIGSETPGPNGGRHKPIADICVAAGCTQGTGATMSTASKGKSSLPKAKRIASDNIRLSDVTYCPKTCRFDAIRPESHCNCKAVTIASCLFIFRTHSGGKWPNNQADSGALIHSRKRGWWSWTPNAGSTSATSSSKYDVIWYGQPGRPSKSMGDFRCQTAHSTHQKVLPGTSLLEKRQLRHTALSATDAQATAMAASVPVLAEEAGHPEVESTEAIIETNLLPAR